MDAGLLLIIFIFIDILFIYKPVPILAFPSMIFFVYLGITQFYDLPITDIPFNPLTTIFFILFCSLSMVVNALSMRD